MEEGSHNYESKTQIKVAILDWDDTLITTTHIFKNQHPSDENTSTKIYRNANASNIEVSNDKLENIGKMVYQLLLKYIRLYGRENIFIVTNAESRWIHLSLCLLHKMCKETSTENHSSSFEAIECLLTTHRINIISAKDAYANKYPNRTTLWKTLVFTEILKPYFMIMNDNANISQTNTNKTISTICIGDSTDEFIASFNAVKILKQAYKIDQNNVILHRIKLKASPSINDMSNQIGLLLTLADTLYKEIKVSETIDYEKELSHYYRK